MIEKWVARKKERKKEDEEVLKCFTVNHHRKFIESAKKYAKLL